MRLLGTLALSTLLIGSLVASPSYAGHHGPPGHGHGHAPQWDETVVDADQGFRGLDAVDRRTAWVTGGSATAGAPGPWDVGAAAETRVRVPKMQTVC